ncbi:VOC family protein [Pseudooceanicola algae]|uniref:PhnB-like domain-containing protein n=1 Tax=Pseudooceanicola algae TaxID=1537215 RepID=A0A418SJC4_9RHOB|nr:VOC family protein [Pseudooceanicola algae]QPM90193.1 hypothetical protein PSAL_014280 [Pseudooceanicola algae]
MRVQPFLMFQGTAAEAAETYAGLFPDGSFRIEQAGPDGEAMLLKVSIGGQDLSFLESPVPHAFGFTPTFSLKVDCDTRAEVDHLYGALIDGGSALMELGEYPFSPWYGWLTDRFGLSWQIGISPTE